MERIYSPREFGKLVGRAVNTLQRWDRKGILVAYRYPTGRRFYTHEHLLQCCGRDLEFATEKDTKNEHYQDHRSRPA